MVKTSFRDFIENNKNKIPFLYKNEYGSEFMVLDAAGLVEIISHTSRSDRTGEVLQGQERIAMRTVLDWFEPVVGVDWKMCDCEWLTILQQGCVCGSIKRYEVSYGK